MNEMKTLLPGQDLKLGGETITLAPFSFGQGPEILGALGEIGIDLLSLYAGMNIEDENFSVDPVTAVAAAELAAKHWGKISKIVSICSKKPVEEIDSADMFEVMDIIVAIFAINKRFFTEWLNRAKSTLKPGAVQPKSNQKKK